MNMHGARAGDGDVKSALPMAYLDKVKNARESHPAEIEITHVRCPWDDETSSEDEQDSSSDDSDGPVFNDEITASSVRKTEEEAAPATEEPVTEKTVAEVSGEDSLPAPATTADEDEPGGYNLPAGWEVQTTKCQHHKEGRHVSAESGDKEDQERSGSSVSVEGTNCYTAIAVPEGEIVSLEETPPRHSSMRDPTATEETIRRPQGDSRPSSSTDEEGTNGGDRGGSKRTQRDSMRQAWLMAGLGLDAAEFDFDHSATAEAGAGDEPRGASGSGLRAAREARPSDGPSSPSPPTEGVKKRLFKRAPRRPSSTAAAGGGR